ncbi:MAG TPA: 7-cyano-7-deazaguanine synthase QueC [Deltaproteobacteria bacterium]|nr:7-cyano-7-deazaguanine synthase QueC [Deltaproteobacteria bacterium]
MRSEAAILLSGGMDSGVLLAWATIRYERIHALSFDYGSKHAARELEQAASLARTYSASLIKIHLPFIQSLFSSSLLISGGEIPEGPYQKETISSTVVPFRNGIFLAIAVGYAENSGIPTVLIASHSGDHPIYPDCRKTFTAAMSAASRLGTFTRVEILAPFSSLNKREIAQKGIEMGFDFSRTWSCYRGGDLHCGTCATCLERKYALRFEEGLDPTRYLE